MENIKEKDIENIIKSISMNDYDKIKTIMNGYNVIHDFDFYGH